MKLKTPKRDCRSMAKKEGIGAIQGVCSGIEGCMSDTKDIIAEAEAEWNQLKPKLLKEASNEPEKECTLEEIKEQALWAGNLIAKLLPLITHARQQQERIEEILLVIDMQKKTIAQIEKERDEAINKRILVTAQRDAYESELQIKIPELDSYKAKWEIAEKGLRKIEGSPIINFNKDTAAQTLKEAEGV